MRKRPGLSAAIVVTLGVGISLNAKADTADWREIAALHTAIREADRLGDFKRADEIATECVTLTSGIQARSSAVPGDYYCTRYLSLALRSGKGLPRDEDSSFVLLRNLVTKYPDDDAALDLVEDYLDGSGTTRDSVEAGVLFWRVEHGGFSIYSQYWGMCDDCRSLSKHWKTVGDRIRRELTRHERNNAATIASDRFPKIAAQAKHRQRQIAGAATFVVALVGSLHWLPLGRHRRRTL
jgi:hypothetical protein